MKDLNFEFEERIFDYTLDKTSKEYIIDTITRNFDGDYEQIAEYLSKDIPENLKELFVSKANSNRKYTQIIDRVLATPIMQTQVKNGETSERKNVGVTFGVSLAEPDDFLAILSVYF